MSKEKLKNTEQELLFALYKNQILDFSIKQVLNESKKQALKGEI